MLSALPSLRHFVSRAHCSSVTNNLFSGAVIAILGGFATWDFLLSLPCRRLSRFSWEVLPYGVSGCFRVAFFVFGYFVLLVGLALLQERNVLDGLVL